MDCGEATDEWYLAPYLLAYMGITGLVTLMYPAMYGRYSTTPWKQLGPQLVFPFKFFGGRALSWFLMESGALFGMLAYWSGGGFCEPDWWTRDLPRMDIRMFVWWAWIVHYVWRALVSPFVYAHYRPGNKSFPLALVLIGWPYTYGNAMAVNYMLDNLPLVDVGVHRYRAGIALVVLGFAGQLFYEVNLLQRYKQEKKLHARSRYIVQVDCWDKAWQSRQQGCYLNPNSLIGIGGVMYRISSFMGFGAPNYLLEIVEFLGFWLVTGEIISLAWFLNCCFFLLPRAAWHKHWSHEVGLT